MNDLEFDRRARALHARSLAELSPRVRAQLHNRQPAASTQARLQRPRWSWATAAVFALALAFGMPWKSAQPPVEGASLAQAQATAPTGLATLEQDPDFYLWLASSDAVALASE
jgi:hypothetical protein